MSPKVVIIADDLTGALDSAVTFAMRGFSVIAARTPELFNAALGLSADVVAVSTSTREGDPETARTVLANIRQTLQHYDGTIFKKIDSRMKGHVLVETEILANLKAGRPLVCPAVPRMGRFVENGAVTGAGVVTPIPIAPFFGSLPVDVSDARSDADLDAVLGARDAQLLVGAAGLAAALARRLASQPAAPAQLSLELPALLAIGSRDPVTIGQMETLTMAGLPLTISNAANGVLPNMTDDPKGVSVVQMISGTTEIEAALASQIFAKAIAAHATAAQPKTLFASGGESANAILDNLGIGLLQVEGEILPGVPCAIARDGVPGLTIVTKSGGFGDPQALVALCQVFLKI